jgi:hypothetical protein
MGVFNIDNSQMYETGSLTPSWVAQVYFGRPIPFVKLGQEQCSEMVSASPRDGLRANRPVLFNCRGVRAENQFGRSRREVLEPQYREVFMIKGFIVQ